MDQKRRTKYIESAMHLQEMQKKNASYQTFCQMCAQSIDIFLKEKCKKNIKFSYFTKNILKHVRCLIYRCCTRLEDDVMRSNYLQNWEKNHVRFDSSGYIEDF